MRRPTSSVLEKVGNDHRDRAQHTSLAVHEHTTHNTKYNTVHSMQYTPGVLEQVGDDHGGGARHASLAVHQHATAALTRLVCGGDGKGLM